MKYFIQDFIAKKGIWVGISLITSRISAFLLSVFAARILSKEDFGSIIFGLNFITIFLTFIGFGSTQGVLKFGSVIDDKYEKKELFCYAFSYGIICNFILTGIMLIIASFLYWDESPKIWIISIFSIRILGIYLVEHKKAEYRANLDNQSFARLDIFLSILSLILGTIFIYFWKREGFLLSLCLSPFFVFLYDFSFKFTLDRIQFRTFTEKEFWKFSYNTALTTQIGELVFILDIFFVGLLMKDRDVASYKVSSMIPMNILVLGFIFMQTEYPKLCQHHRDKRYQYRFIFNYWKLFTLIGCFILLIGFIFDYELLSIFGNQYQDIEIYRILLLGSIISLLFRVLFVYMLATIGKQLWNLIISIFMLFFISLSLYFIIPNYGLKGVSYITFTCLTLSGILPALAYFYESKKILK